MIRRGMTLVEMVVVLAILAAVSGMAVAMTGTIDDGVRQQETARRLSAIRTAILGPDACTGDGRLVFGGFLQDCGRMPRSLGELIDRPLLGADKLAAYDAEHRCGWRGPYLPPLPPRSAKGEAAPASPTLYDDWGDEFQRDPIADGWRIASPTHPRLCLEIARTAYEIGKLPPFRVVLRNLSGTPLSDIRIEVRILGPDAEGRSAPLATWPIASRLTLGTASDDNEVVIALPGQEGPFACGRRRLAVHDAGASGNDRELAATDLAISPAIEIGHEIPLRILRRIE